MCDKLRLSRRAVLALARKGCLAVIWGPYSNVKITSARFLDPSSEYAEHLRLGEIIHNRLYPVPAGLSEKSLLTTGECAELLGITPLMMNRYMRRHAIPSIRVDKKHFLFSPLVVREAMLRRSKRTAYSQKSVFLIAELVELFRSRLSAEISIIPTDKEFAADEALQKRLSLIVTESQKADFARKVKLAQQVVQILEWIKELPTSQSSSSE